MSVNYQGRPCYISTEDERFIALMLRNILDQYPKSKARIEPYVNFSKKKTQRFYDFKGMSFTIKDNTPVISQMIPLMGKITMIYKVPKSYNRAIEGAYKNENLSEILNRCVKQKSRKPPRLQTTDSNLDSCPVKDWDDWEEALGKHGNFVNIYKTRTPSEMKHLKKHRYYIVVQTDALEAGEDFRNFVAQCERYNLQNPTSRNLITFKHLAESNQYRYITSVARRNAERLMMKILIKGFNIPVDLKDDESCWIRNPHDVGRQRMAPCKRLSCAFTSSIDSDIHTRNVKVFSGCYNYKNSWGRKTVIPCGLLQNSYLVKNPQFQGDNGNVILQGPMKNNSFVRCKDSQWIRDRAAYVSPQVTWEGKKQKKSTDNSRLYAYAYDDDVIRTNLPTLCGIPYGGRQSKNSSHSSPKQKILTLKLVASKIPFDEVIEQQQ